MLPSGPTRPMNAEGKSPNRVAASAKPCTEVLYQSSARRAAEDARGSTVAGGGAMAVRAPGAPAPERCLDAAGMGRSRGSSMPTRPGRRPSLGPVGPGAADGQDPSRIGLDRQVQDAAVGMEPRSGRLAAL